MRKIFLGIFLIISAVLVGCQGPIEPPIKYTVTFDSDGGEVVASQEVVEGELATEPSVPIREGFIFQYWQIVGETGDFKFTTPIISNLQLIAIWVKDNTPIIAKINADIGDVEDNLLTNPHQLSLPSRGAVNNSNILWSINSKYITSTGILLPIPKGMEGESTEATINAIFSLNGQSVTKQFIVQLPTDFEAEITNSRTVSFTNMTTEYAIADGELELFFETGGSVPYVNLNDFFGLLKGFIDPETDFTTESINNTLTISYDYLDETTGEIYHLNCTLNASDDTITTNDPGFFWAYIYSTATNYGRNIIYDNDNPNNYYIEGHDVVYDLDNYNLDIPVYGGEILLPFYVANQLFAGSSYYNVYYNYDKLLGVYGSLDISSPEYASMRNSSKQNSAIPADLLVHNFNMLAFNMDNFYGLKDIMEVSTYYDYLLPQASRFLTTSAQGLDQSIFDFLVSYIDEPHTSYGQPSYFNRASYDGPYIRYIEDFGPRMQDFYINGLWAVDDALFAKWDIPATTSSWAADTEYRPKYWFLDEKSAVLTLDGFYTLDINEATNFNDEIIESIMGIADAGKVLPSVEGGSKYLYYNLSGQEEKIMETLVKGIDSTYLATYRAALLEFGYEYHSGESDDEYKQDGYYTITVDDTTYMVQIAYDETYGLFYFGIADEAPANYEDDWIFLVDIFSLIVGDSAVYMEVMMEKIISEKPEITSIVLDLTFNMGGNVGALYRVLGFVTDQSYAVSSMDGETDGSSTTHVRIEGLPSYSHLNWALLISPVTFSAANELATIFMENNLGKIIGQQSGGGACSITPILLPCGTSFTMSSNNINAYRTGAGTEDNPYVYIANEFGITPKYSIDDVMDLYDEDILREILAK